MANLARVARWSATVVWAAAGVALLAATALDARARWLVPPTPPEVTHDLFVPHAPDLQGRRASFRILLFSDEFRWRLNSFDEVEERPDGPRFTDEMKAVLNSAREIICVGTSSEEIPAGATAAEGRAQEEWRAARRAERIALWVREALSHPVPVRKLNVGHHAPTRARDTSDQRRVVIILVLDADRDTNLDQALRTAMAGERDRAPIFDALLSRYSLAAGERFTWVP